MNWLSGGEGGCCNRSVLDRVLSCFAIKEVEIFYYGGGDGKRTMLVAG